jgi:hypothetical protein
VDDEIALEPEKEMLAVRVDARHGASGEPLWPVAVTVTRVRRPDLVGHPAVKERADPVCGRSDRVSLRQLRPTT